MSKLNTSNGKILESCAYVPLNPNFIYNLGQTFKIYSENRTMNNYSPKHMEYTIEIIGVFAEPKYLGASSWVRASDVIYTKYYYVLTNKPFNYNYERLSEEQLTEKLRKSNDYYNSNINIHRV